jgi:hypothetical protein
MTRPDLVALLPVHTDAHVVYESTVRVDRRESWWPPMPMPDGLDGDTHGAIRLVAVIDAENDLVAYVPDRPGLVNPDRPLPELLAALLTEAADHRGIGLFEAAAADLLDEGVFDAADLRDALARVVSRYDAREGSR